MRFINGHQARRGSSGRGKTGSKRKLPAEGLVFNRLTTTGRYVVIQKKAHAITMWECDCSCGSGRKLYIPAQLKSGVTSSCGCFRTFLMEEKWKGHDYLPALNREVFRMIHKSAVARDIPFHLSIEDTLKLAYSPCVYCGRQPSNVIREKGSRAEHKWNGLDRVDSYLPYSMDNVVSCCWSCNKIKGTTTRGEFLEAVERIHAYQQTQSKDEAK